MYEIKIFFRDGKEPYFDWLLALRDVQARARIRTRIDRLTLGNMGDCRALDGGLFELRIDWGAGYRVYFSKLGKTVVLLLCGGDKSTQQADIKTAKKFLKEYQHAENRK
jgi:putative addiction module killer protein